jgi:hypothetical protein
MATNNVRDITRRIGRLLGHHGGVMKKLGLKAVRLCAMLFLAGTCGAEIVRSANSGDEAQAKTFPSDPNAARLYVFRAKSMAGSHLKSNLIVGKKVVTENGNDEFSVVILAPGDYELECASEKDSNAAVGFMHNLKKEPLKLKAESGHIYFVQEVFKAIGGFHLKVLSREQAEPIIKKGMMVATVTLN